MRHRVFVTEASQVAEARRASASVAASLAFDETDSGRVALVATELATNLVKHGRDGELLVATSEGLREPGVEIVAIDRGPGIADVAKAMADGYSTAGSPGTGLGAVRRVASAFELQADPARGNVVLARVARRGDAAARATSNGGLAVGGVCVAHPSESACGDDWTVERQAHRVLVVMADGLGHGPLAADAASAAVRHLPADPSMGPAAHVQAAHARLARTRGAALAVAKIDMGRGVLRYAGVGNVSAVLIAGGQHHHLVSHNGIVGHAMRRVQELELAWTDDSLLVMFTDGLTTQGRLPRIDGALGRDPTLVAAVLYRDRSRRRDDSTVAVVGRPAP